MFVAIQWMDGWMDESLMYVFHTIEIWDSIIRTTLPLAYMHRQYLLGIREVAISVFCILSVFKVG